MTHVALEEVIVAVTHPVFLQVPLGVVGRATPVALVRLPAMTRRNVPLQTSLMIESFQAKRTRSP